MTRDWIGEVILTRPRRRDPFVPLGVPGAFTTYRLSDTADLEEDLARIAPFIAPFEASARSRANRPTRHRLIALVEAAEADVNAHQAGGVGPYLPDVVELGQVVPLLLQWSADPAGAEIIADFKDPDVYAHSILVLAAARSLRAWGNDVQLVRKQPTRAPDVNIVTDRGRVAVELKAPREFDGRDWQRQKSPQQLASDVLKRSSSQRRTAATSVLIVAGYRIPELIREVLMDELSTRLFSRPQLAAVLILSIGGDVGEHQAAAAAVADRAPITRTLTREETQTVLAVPITLRVLRNEHYTGPTEIVDLGGSKSGLHLPGRSMIVRASPPMPQTRR